MDCPNCGTYNPEDREVCWRCDQPLPKPKQVKKKNPQRSAQTWLYVAVALFAVITVLQMCGFKLPGMGGAEPEGRLLERPAIVYQMPEGFLG